MTKFGTVQKKSNKYIVAGATASTALMAAHSVIPAAVLAANQHDWIKQEGIDVVGDQFLSSAAMSASGSDLMVSGGESGTGLYISANYGASWQNVAEEADPGNINRWTAVDVSNNGQTMVAVSQDTLDSELGYIEGKIFASTNGGTSWSDVSPADTDDWSDIVVSGDGTTIAAVTVGSGDVYISENNGADWTTSPYDDTALRGKNIAISDNGEKILVGGENGDDTYTHLFISEDSGDTWAQIDPAVEDEVHTLSPAISADGNTIAVATVGFAYGHIDSVYMSNNDGSSWSDISPNDELASDWEDLDLSDDGSTLALVDNDNNKFHVSNDAGETWNEEDPSSGEDSNYWKAADLNSDGSRILVASEDAAYLNFVESVEVPSVILGNAENGKAITITTPEGTTITCSSAAKESGLDAQDGDYTYPLGLVDFCFSGAESNNEISLLFVTNLKPDEVLVRKYNPGNNQYSTIEDAEVSETTYDGKPALLVTYNIVDNGPLDLDPDVGEIADPVGLAVADTDATLADTGSNASTSGLVAISLLGLGLSFVLRQKRQITISK